MRSKSIIGTVIVSSALLLVGCDDSQKAHLDQAGDDIADSAKNVGDSAKEEYDKAKASVQSDN